MVLNDVTILIITWNRTEKDCTNWSHEYLKENLITVPLVRKVTKVEGEVTVHVRKGRIRQIFDMNIEMELEEGGTARITDYMSDTEFGGFEFSAPGLPVDRRSDLKKKIWDELEEFKRKVEKTHGASLLVQQSGNPPVSAGGDVEKKGSRFTGADEDLKPEDSSVNGGGGGGRVTTIEETIEFNAPSTEVWMCLRDPSRMAIWSRGTAQLNSFEPGASFKLFNENIIGTVTYLTGQVLRMDWRLKHWSYPTQVEVKLEDTKGRTKLHLKQIGVPKEEADAVRENWHRYYWEPIKTMLGCSSTII